MEPQEIGHERDRNSPRMRCACRRRRRGRAFRRPRLRRARAQRHRGRQGRDPSRGTHRRPVRGQPAILSRAGPVGGLRAPCGADGGDPADRRHRLDVSHRAQRVSLAGDRPRRLRPEHREQRAGGGTGGGGARQSGDHADRGSSRRVRAELFRRAGAAGRRRAGSTPIHRRRRGPQFAGAADRRHHGQDLDLSADGDHRAAQARKAAPQHFDRMAQAHAAPSPSCRCRAARARRIAPAWSGW